MSSSAATEQVNNHATSFDEVSAFNRRAFFVGGAPKSGTTLLLTLLDSHPQLVVLPKETHYMDERRKYSRLQNFPAKLKRLLTHSELRRLEEEARSSKDARVAADYERFVRIANELVDQPWMNDSLLLSETVRAYALSAGLDWQQCVRWVEKTPSNIPYSDDLFRLFPDAKLLHILRDPRAVFASRRRLLLDRYGSYAKAHRLVREWNEGARQINKLRKRPGNYLVIYYEDLVRNSHEVMNQVCRFIGIDFLPSLLEPTSAGKKWAGHSAYYSGFNGIDTRPLNEWKNQLTEDEIWWVELHCHEGMKIAGYELQTNAKFSLSRWAKRFRGESLGGYLRSRRGSLCQFAGLLKDSRYDLGQETGPAQMASTGMGSAA